MTLPDKSTWTSQLIDPRGLGRGHGAGMVQELQSSAVPLGDVQRKGELEEK